MNNTDKLMLEVDVIEKVKSGVADAVLGLTLREGIIVNKIISSVTRKMLNEIYVEVQRNEQQHG